MTKTELIDYYKSLSVNECLIFVTKNNRHWVMINPEIILNNDGYNFLSDYDEDLTTKHFDSYTIIEIHKTHYGCGFTTALTLNNLNNTLIWKREEVIELTLDEIANKFGVQVSQLKIKK